MYILEVYIILRTWYILRFTCKWGLHSLRPPVDTPGQKCVKNFFSGVQEFFVMYDWTRILKQIWIFEDCFMTLTSAHWVFHSLPDTINWEKSWDVYFRLHTSHTGLDQDPRLTIYPVFGISQSQWQQISLYWSEAILIKDMMDCVFLKRCLLLFDRFDSKVGIKPLTYYIFLQGVKKLW